MNTAIIVAAGNGSRFGSERPKQFLEILGKPIIQYSLERFDAAPSIDSIVVVVSADEVEKFAQLSRDFGVGKLKFVVAGGATRASSVSNGLRSVDDACEIVAVHDAARPLVTVDEIERAIAAAAKSGAACLTAPVNDTIKLVDGGEITGTVDRTRLRRALTPQAFRFSLLRQAFEAVGTGENITDECSLVERLGHPIIAVAGNSVNIKVTHPEDLVIVEAFIRNGYLDQV
ncbi:MAG: 2-C-methyl-D-erythritol 4-phosphate cytidylyltransferase [Acidobacteriota bacterium]